MLRPLPARTGSSRASAGPTARLGAGSWLGLLALAATWAFADEPRAWLARADQAAATRNYLGVFVHEHAGESETLRIVHRADASGVAERLVSMDGSGREFIRKGSQLFIYLPDRHTVMVEQNPAAGLWLHGLPTFDETAASAYDIRELARSRVSGRDARLIAITPLDALRYGYRVWIDEATALPLKTQLRDGNGTVLEQIVFTDLTLPAHIADGELEPAVDAHDFHWLQRGTGAAEGGGMSASWQAGALPPGFRMTASARQVLTRGPVEHLVFSDGLASVSVFIERAHAQSAARNADAAARLGVSSAYSTAVAGYRVTAVGEVPPETVRAIALSIRTAGPSPSLVEAASDAKEASESEDEAADTLPIREPQPVPGNALSGIGTGGAGQDADTRSAFGGLEDSSSAWAPRTGARH